VCAHTFSCERLAACVGILAADATIEALKNDSNEPAMLTTYPESFKQSWLYKELWGVRNFRPSFKYGLWAGVALAGLDWYVPLAFRHPDSTTCIVDAHCNHYHSHCLFVYVFVYVCVYVCVCVCVCVSVHECSFVLQGKAPWTLQHAHPDNESLLHKKDATPIAYPNPVCTLKFFAAIDWRAVRVVDMQCATLRV
jgi:hypothetical protein